MPKEADLYEKELGAEARERQVELAKFRFVCCGMPKHLGHHENCSLRPEDEPDGPMDGQESLL